MDSSKKFALPCPGSVIENITLQYKLNSFLLN